MTSATTPGTPTLRATAVAGLRSRVALPDVPGVRLSRLTAIELRKSVDTRAGGVLLAATLLLTLAPVVWQLLRLDGATPAFGEWTSWASSGVVLLLPVLGILATTSEWTQRTALTTFTLVPRRGRVLAAKLVGAVLLGVVVMGFALAVAALATVGVAEVRDTAPVWGEVGRQVGGSLLASVLNIVRGAAFGALLGQTAVAIALFASHRRRGRWSAPPSSEGTRSGSTSTRPSAGSPSSR